MILRSLKCETDWTACKSNYDAIHATFSNDKQTGPTPAYKAVDVNTDMIKLPEITQEIRGIFRENGTYNYITCYVK